jgi:hypothetical protein
LTRVRRTGIEAATIVVEISVEAQMMSSPPSRVKSLEARSLSFAHLTKAVAAALLIRLAKQCEISAGGQCLHHTQAHCCGNADLLFLSHLQILEDDPGDPGKDEITDARVCFSTVSHVLPRISSDGLT